MSNYASLVGFVQFDPQVRDVNGQQVKEFMVRAVGFQGQPLVKVTLWPEFADSFDLIQQGVYVAVDGKYNQGSGEGGKVYHNLSASSLLVLEPAAKADRGTRVANPVESRRGTAAPF